MIAFLTHKSSNSTTSWPIAGTESGFRTRSMCLLLEAEKANEHHWFFDVSFEYSLRRLLHVSVLLTGNESLWQHRSLDILASKSWPGDLFGQLNFVFIPSWLQAITQSRDKDAIEDNAMEYLEQVLAWKKIRKFGAKNARTLYFCTENLLFAHQGHEAVQQTTCGAEQVPGHCVCWENTEYQATVTPKSQFRHSALFLEDFHLVWKQTAFYYLIQ